MACMCFVIIFLLFGKFSGIVGTKPDEEVIIPEQLTLDYQPVDSFNEGILQKRAVYRLQAFGKEMILDLQRDQSFMSENLIVQYLGSFQADADSETSWTECYYTGTVNADPESVVACSLCGPGLHGVIRYQGEEMHIQPLKEDQDNSVAVPHIVRRKAPLKPVGSTCSVEPKTFSKGLGLGPKVQGRDSPVPPGTKRRAKRFVSAPRYVETLVVADSSMVNFHGSGLKHYLLTVMAATAKFFKHPSIKNSVNLVVTRIVMIGRGDDQGLHVSSNAAQTLKNFCTWQKGLNTPSDSDTDHFDTAILFTRQDLCGSSTCDTLGMADVGTVCDMSHSCSIVEDDGLQSSFTAAHELGHVFNMLHDNAKACQDFNRGSQSSHLMAPVMTNVDPHHLWSPCSAHFITDFLDGGHGQCLLDKPTQPLRMPGVLPGDMYDIDNQCHLAFGPDSHHCPDFRSTCSSLWCTGKIDGHFMCQTKHFPWADGTTCGQGKTCLRGRCIGKAELKEYTTPINGGWGAWGPWGECSRTCGSGVQFSTRGCDKPVPRNGGKYCEGKRIQYRSCNIQNCPNNNGKTFRDEQCATYNERSDLFPGHSSGTDWVPKYTGISDKDRCKLTCQSKEKGYYYVMSQKVADGTPCGPDTTSVCVRGQCMDAGCDRVIGSKKKLDKCQVCGGNGSTCTKVFGSFKKPRYGYNDVVTFPAGATSIFIQQHSISKAPYDNVYLALKKSDGTNILNGNYILAPSERDISVDGLTLHYSGALRDIEIIRCAGPLKTPITLQALVTADRLAPKLKYTYFVPKRPVVTKQTNEISTIDWYGKKKAMLMKILRRPRI
ncbi:A disintegrin and metalloproteinase with thrombospondin motifs 4 [Protopterus annectens]|uniref:A disintegrin and metalloproteinase with thrombospondin motifs 4 n=1 Tax=Protopterus annectens TaxID=7888 RepID=UPI001CFC14A1|nr:A disintegrin and metalloproteinase with thrombospondin motifs 4 [Protopterus annectens]